jgi:hypothetical protein
MAGPCSQVRWVTLYLVIETWLGWRNQATTQESSAGAVGAGACSVVSAGDEELRPRVVQGDGRRPWVLVISPAGSGSLQVYNSSCRICEWRCEPSAVPAGSETGHVKSVMEADSDLNTFLRSLTHTVQAASVTWL